MKIEATADQIRSLLRLAECDARAGAAPGGRRGASLQHRALPRTLLEHYEGLVEAGRTPALVAVERGTCGGCHVRLPTMLASKLTRAAAVHLCPVCRRLLYAAERVFESVEADDAKRPRRSERATRGRA